MEFSPTVFVELDWKTQTYVITFVTVYEQVFHTKTLNLYSEIPGFTDFFLLTCPF